MRETKKKVNGGNEDSKKKERHIVTWSQEEDDILRQQISLHGTENWSIIASKFKDKTTRQCRRRWFTYLNSDFKKGGWSPEEDLILCEAQRIYGNRWTEIAKVVSGRTDNAVKNRFTTLCKKKAKYEALAKDNKNGLINSNNKRIILPNVFKTDETPENVAPAKKMRRSHIPYHTETCNFKDRSHLQYGTQQARPPFAVLAQNIRNVDTVYQPQVGNVKEEVPNDASHSKTQGTFLKKGDPKITALMQQAELLGSLALKVNTDNTEQSLEHAWKVLQDFLNQGKENDLGYRISDLDIQLEDFKDLIEDLKISNDGSQLCWRQPDLYESPASSEYSTGSTLLPYTAADTMEQNQAEVGVLQEDIGTGSIPSEAKHGASECQEVMVSGTHATQVEIYGSCDEQTNNEIAVSASSSTEFSSPHQVTPLFRSLAAGIPSPQFSESERNFLLKTLGVESPCPNPSANPSQPPTCKRALIQSL